MKPSRRRSRLFFPAILAAGVTLALFIPSMWVSLGRVQSMGTRFAAVVADGGRVGVAVTRIGTPTRSHWLAEGFDFHFDPWFEIEQSPQALYVSVPLWAPLLVFGIIAWRTRPRVLVPNHCVACGYDLAGIGAPACPECGMQQSQPRA